MTNKRRAGIPAARARLESVVNAIEARATDSEFKEWCLTELKQALFDMRRNSIKGTRSKRVSAPIDGMMVLAVKKYALENPDAANRKIASLMNIADGRVTDILNGKYDHKLPGPIQRLFEAHGMPTIRQLELVEKEMAA